MADLELEYAMEEYADAVAGVDACFEESGGDCGNECQERVEKAKAGLIWAVLSESPRVKALEEVVRVSSLLRSAQADYMEHRGDDFYGKIVAERASELDGALDALRETEGY